MFAKCRNKCVNEYQDKTYGEGVRVFNILSKESTVGNKQGKCTCCGNVQNV